jgi:hypothetical protein
MFLLRQSAVPQGDGEGETTTAAVAFSTTTPTISVVEAGQPAAVAVEIVTASGGPVTSYAADTITYSTGAGWVSTSFGNLPSGRYGVTITVDPATLSAGAPTATIPILLGNAAPASQDLTLTVTVTPAQPGTLVATAKFLAATATAGDSPSPVTVTLSCVGGNHTLAGPSIGSETYNPVIAAWCVTTPTDNGDGTYTLTLTPSVDALAAGTYRYAFGVTDANTTNTAEIILDVTLSATPAVLLNASPGALSFTAVEGGSDPATQGVLLTNVGAGDLDGPTVTEGTGSAWLSASVPAGGSNVATVTGTTGALAEGVYTDTLRYTDTAAAAASIPQIVAVSFTVQSGTQPQRSTTATLERLSGNNATPSLLRGWCGVPLPPGWLNPGNTSQFRLRDGSGNEIPIYVEALGGTHADGSLKMLYVEFDRTLALGTPETITMECGVSRNTAQDLTRTKASGLWDGLLTSNTTSIWKTGTFPDAIVNFPASYLSTTQFWGPYDLRYKGKSGGPTWQAAYFVDWEGANDTWWNFWTTFTIGNGVASFDRTQYDYPAHTFMLWASTGDAEYFKRGCATLVEWRNRYLRTNTKNGVIGGDISVWEHCPWGMAFHYWLTGDNTTRTDLASFAFGQSTPSLVSSSVDDYESEPRPLAYVLYSLLACKQIGATAPTSTWDARITAWLAKWLPVSLAHPGWITTGTWTGAFWNRIMYQGCTLLAGNPPATQLVQNFMNGLLIGALDQYLTFGDGTYASDAQTRMDGMCTYLLNTQSGTNSNGVTAHHYNNQGGCGQQGHTLVDQVNINGVFAGAFGVAGRRLNTTSYLAHARTLLETTTFTPNTGAWGPYIYNSSRTYNETFHRAWEALAKVY